MRLGSIIILCAFALGACANPQSMRSRTPDFTFITQNKLDDIRSCLGENWASSNPGWVPNYIPREKAFSFILEGGPATDLVIDVVDCGVDRQVTVYVRRFVVSFFKTEKNREIIEQCTVTKS